MVRKGAIEEASPHSRAFYGRLFTVPKSSGGLRPVLDLSPLNKYLQVIHFRMETPQSIRDSIRQGDWATSLDLKDAYFHVPMHRNSRKFLRFVWNSRVYQFRALPFGLSLAPWVFTKVTRELAILARAKGIRLRMYLDDWLTLASSRPRALTHTEELLDLTVTLGFLPNWEKSALAPSQQFVYLGMAFDTVTYTVRPAPARLLKFRTLRDSLLMARSASARLLSSLLGQMESLAPLVPLGHVHKRKFQRQFRKRWHQSHQSWEFQLPLGVWFSRSLAQWLDEEWLQLGVPIAPPPCEEELFTDASNVGWGAHVAHLEASGRWPDSMIGLHINVLELEAVFLALKKFEWFLRNKRILICTDNTTVACYIKKGGGVRSITLSKRAENLLKWCHFSQISISAKYVPGKMNVVADALSRSSQVIQTEWTLTHSVLEPVWRTWHKPMVDLFATKFNHRLPLYYSPVPDPQALGQDALNLSWRDLIGYAFPPLALLSKVIRKARIEQASLILVTPYWPYQPWFPDLLELTHSPPLKLAVHSDGLVQPRSGIPHGNPGFLNLHAWLLCGQNCSH